MNLLDRVQEQIIKALPDVRAIYRFGSATTRFETAASDLDLAILPAIKLDALKRFELEQALARSIQKEVDLVDLLETSTVMQFQVISTGERLYCADENECSAFESRIFSDYVRLNEERREIIQEFKKRRLVGAHGIILTDTV